MVIRIILMFLPKYYTWYMCLFCFTSIFMITQIMKKYFNFQAKNYTIYFILKSQHFLHLSGSKHSVTLTTSITLSPESSLTKFQTNLKPAHSSWMRNRIIREIQNPVHSLPLLTCSFIYSERLLSAPKFSLGREQMDPGMQCQHLSV